MSHFQLYIYIKSEYVPKDKLSKIQTKANKKGIKVSIGLEVRV